MYSDNTNLSICNMTTLKKKKFYHQKSHQKEIKWCLAMKCQIKVNQAWTLCKLRWHFRLLPATMQFVMQCYLFEFSLRAYLLFSNWWNYCPEVNLPTLKKHVWSSQSSYSGLLEKWKYTSRCAKAGWNKLCRTVGHWRKGGRPLIYSMKSLQPFTEVKDMWLHTRMVIR